VLLAVQAPLVAVTHGARGVRAHVAAALALGQEHPTLPGLVGVEALEPGDDLVTDAVGRVTAHDVGRARGHTEPAVHRGLGLAHEVRERRGDDRRYRAPGVRGKADEAGPHEIGLGLGPGGVVLDLADLVPPPVAAHEYGRMVIRDLGAPRDVATAQHAEAADVLLGEGAVVGIRQQPVEQLAQVRVDGVPVEPDRVVEFRVVG
jgi:hypothetical protein